VFQCVDAAGNLTGKVYHDADDFNRELNTSKFNSSKERLECRDDSINENVQICNRRFDPYIP